MSPKDQFQSFHKDDADAFAKTIGEPHVQMAMLHAFAELASGGATTEQLAGARTFIAILNKISDPVKISTLPTKELKTY